MEEELLKQILQELQDQSGTSFLDFLQLMAPALVAFAVGLVGGAVGIYGVQYGTRSELNKLSIERRLEWRRETYNELTDALAEFIAALDYTLEAKWRLAQAVFEKSSEQKDFYGTLYDSCVERFEKIRSSGRLSQARLKIEDHEIGELVRTLAEEAELGHLTMIAFATKAMVEFEESGSSSGSEARYMPEDHAVRRTEIDEKAHQISKLIEERISLTD